MNTRFLRLFSAVMAVSACVSLFAMPSPASAAAPANALVKGSGPAVYWVTANGKRYAFPNIRAFWSWYPSDKLNEVVTLNDADLAAYQLAGNVTYRPGAKLVKIQTDPKVYAVSRYGVLHWVMTESLAAQLYGANWNTKIDDVPDTFFTNYTVGSQIANVWDFNVGNEYTSVANPSDNIRDTVAADAFTIVLSKYEAVKNENVTLTASLPAGMQTQNPRIELRDDAGALLKTCQGVTCGATVSLPDNAATRSFTASAQYDTAAGTKWTDTLRTTLRLFMPNLNLTGSALVSAEAVPNGVGLQKPLVRVVATAVNMSVTDPNVTIRIYRAEDNRLLAACAGSVTCVAEDSRTDLTTPTSLGYFAIVNDSRGQALAPVSTSVNVLALYGPDNFGKWVFTSTDYGTPVTQTHDQETGFSGFRLDAFRLTYQGIALAAADRNGSVAPGAPVHLTAVVSGEKTTDRVTVEVRDLDGTAIASCSGAGTATCEANATFNGAYKNHFFIVRASDQLGRVREFRPSEFVYVGGTEGFGGSVRLLLDKTAVSRGDAVQFAAKIMGETAPIADITTRIVNIETGTTLASNRWTSECKTKAVINADIRSLSFTAIAFDRQGREMRAYVSSPLSVASATNIQ